MYLLIFEYAKGSSNLVDSDMVVALVVLVGISAHGRSNMEAPSMCENICESKSVKVHLKYS